jgi:RimJ/RimL family protein N-acetyltransferase
MHIELQDYQIRSYRDSDIPSLVHHANNRKLWLQLRDRFPNPYRAEDARKWIQGVRSRQPESSFVIATEREAIGVIGLELQSDVHRHSAELGYWVGEAYWGRGIATLAVQALADHAFTQQRLLRLFALVFETNPASCRVLEKAGFEREGQLRRSVFKNGRVLDQFLYARCGNQDPTDG